jgi:two-component system, chemotaxis family, response regulator Rcp1
VGHASSRGVGRPVEILIIDDSPGDVRLLQEAFEELQSNIKLQVARDGVEGLQMVLQAFNSGGEWRPDLILLDLNLPKIDGHEVLAQLKDDARTKLIPVIVLTSSRAESDVRRAYACHANAYLKKPNSLESLLTAAQDIANFWVRTATLPSH